MQLGLAAVATAAIVAGFAAKARANSGGNVLELSDPLDAMRAPGRRIAAARLSAPALAVTRYNTEARTPTPDEMEVMVYEAVRGTYMAIRDIRWPRWKKDRSAYERGEMTLEELWHKAAGHVATCLVFGGQWDRVDGVQPADLVGFWLDWIVRNHAPADHAGKVRDLISLVLTRPNNSEIGWMMDYCKPLYFRMVEGATLAGDLGRHPSLSVHPCDVNTAAAGRFPMWTAARSQDLAKLDGASAEQLVGFLLKLQGEKSAIPQAGYPSEPNFSLSALFETLGTMFAQAMSLQVLAMIDTARDYCASESANADGC